MVARLIDQRELCEAAEAAYQDAIRAGWPGSEDKSRTGQSGRSAVGVAADKLGVTIATLKARRRAFAAINGGAPSMPPPDARPIVDLVEEHRLKREADRLRRENRDLAERLASANDFRKALDGVADPLEPVTFQRISSGPGQPETAVLVISDLQWGETIDLAVMDGLNSFNVDIARARLARLFAAFCDLVTRHWAGPPPERVIIVLGGDLISGEIHEELAKTNGLLSIPALRDCAAYLCAGIRLVHETLPGVAIEIISVPGNHGRNTKKTESKLYAAHSYDTLVADLIELEFKEGGRWPEWFTMWKPSSGDALIWIYGHRVLITHGDRIGSRGGAGFVGTAATVARGFKKLVMDYAGRNEPLDFVICGHFHTALQLEEGICNGCLPGPSEYSRDLRFRPRPAVQAFLTFHPKRGLTQMRWISVGDPSEGSLYAPRPIPKSAKPRFRIPAIGV